MYGKPGGATAVKGQRPAGAWWCPVADSASKGAEVRVPAAGAVLGVLEWPGMESRARGQSRR